MVTNEITNRTLRHKIREFIKILLPQTDCPVGLFGAAAAACTCYRLHHCGAAWYAVQIPALMVEYINKEFSENKAVAHQNE